jgi:HK97 family phage portal protein
MAWFRWSRKSEGIPVNTPGSVANWVGMMGGVTPARRGSAELLTACNTEPNLRRVVGKISTEVGSIHWHVYRATSSKLSARSLARAHSAKEFRERFTKAVAENQLKEIEDHPLTEVLERPNPVMTGVQMLSLMTCWLDLVGEAPAIKERAGMKMLRELWPIVPTWLRSVDPDSRNPAPFIVQEPNKSPYPVLREDMLWLRHLDVTNPYKRGSGIGMSLADEIDTSEYAAKYLKNFFANDATPRLMIGIEGADKPALEAAKATWLQRLQGVTRAFMPHFFSGKLEVKELSKGLNDNQILPLRKSSRDVFQETFGIPPEIVGLVAGSNRATAHEASRIYFENCIIPRAEFWRQNLQHECDDEYGPGYVVGYDSPSPTDRDYQLDVVRAAPYHFTRGEIREMGGQENRGEQDAVFMVPAMLIEVRDGEPKEPPAPPAPAPTPPPAEPTPGEEQAPETLAPTDEGKSLSPVVKDDKDKKKIAEILDALDPDELTSRTEAEFYELVKVWGDEALAEVGISSAFNMVKPGVTDFLQAMGTEHIGGLVDETTRQAIKDTLSEAVDLGEDVRRMRDRVMSVFDVADQSRAEDIARTEVGRASNWATLEGYDQSGIVPEKEWISTKDGRTRGNDEDDEFDHVSCDGQVQPLHDPFDVSGEELQYPGDDAGSAGNVINCRCTQVAKIGAPKEEAARVAIWKAYDRRRIPWETRLRTRLQEGFGKQRDAVVAAVETAFAD